MMTVFKMKKALGRNRPEDTDKLIFTRNLAALSKVAARTNKAFWRS